MPGGIPGALPLPGAPAILEVEGVLSVLGAPAVLFEAFM